MKTVEKFNIRIVKTGDKYGLNDCLVNNKEPLIEFYDSRYPHHPERGQFVTRYLISTLTKTANYPFGLCLDGGIPEWSVSAEGMKQVMEYIQQ